jgi:hypothetical protein
MARDAGESPRGRVGEVRQADPAAAAQDPENAATQERIRRDHDAMQAQAERVRASVPPEIRDRTVGEIVDDAERRAEADRRESEARVDELRTRDLRAGDASGDSGRFGRDR